MANIIKIKRYSVEANIPLTGLNQGEFMLALDTKNLWLAWSATDKINICKSDDLSIYMENANNLSDIANYAIARSNLDVFSKGEVNNLLGGLNWKPDVLAVTTSNITLSGLQTIDGVTLPAGARVGVVAQNTATENGIYIASTVAWLRSTDADSTTELSGATFSVAQGSTQADTIWRVFTDTIVLGSTSINIQPFTGIKNIVSGLGITITGNTIDIALEELSGNAVYSADDYIIMVDVSATGQARQVRMKVSDFLTGTGIISDTYQIKVNSGGAAGFLTDKLDVTTGKGLKKTITGDKIILEQDVNAMTTSPLAIGATADAVAVYNAANALMYKATPQKLVENVTLDGGTY